MLIFSRIKKYFTIASALKFIKNLIIFFILGLRPLFGPPNTSCRFPITCTEFAEEQLTLHPLSKALWAIFKRILTCNPFFRSF